MSDTETLLPVYHKNGTELKMFSTAKFCSMEIQFPKFGLEATATHCSVSNFLPSISAAIGHYYPQIYVWNSTIILQIYPRLKISKMYLHYYCSVIYEKYANWYNAAVVFHLCEIWSLLGLSLVTSTSNYFFHALCFTCFLFTSMLNMILACYLLKYKRKVPPGNLELRTLRWKFQCCILNIFCFLMAGYFFRRHNLYCEPKVYSIFAFFEYGVVISNMLFHQLAIWDFHDRTITFALTSRGLEVGYNPPFKSIQYSNIE